MTCFCILMCDKERVVKEYKSILFKWKSRISVFIIMLPIKGNFTLAPNVDSNLSIIFLNKLNNCYMWRNIKLKFLEFVFLNKLIIKSSSWIYHSLKPIYVWKGLAGGVFRQGTQYLCILLINAIENERVNAWFQN